MCRIPKERRVLTKALHAYPKKHGLKIEWLAIELWNQFDIDLAHSTLERYLNPNDTPKLPGDIVGPICQICNNDFSAVDLIKIRPGGRKLGNSHIARLLKEVGKTVATISKSLEDGVIDHMERSDCIKDAIEAKEVLNDILSRLIK